MYCKPLGLVDKKSWSGELSLSYHATSSSPWRHHPTLAKTISALSMMTYTAEGRFVMSSLSLCREMVLVWFPITLRVAVSLGGTVNLNHDYIHQSDTLKRRKRWISPTTLPHFLILQFMGCITLAMECITLAWSGWPWHGVDDLGHGAMTLAILGWF